MSRLWLMVEAERVRQRNAMRQHRRRIREGFMPAALDDIYFVKHFRLTKCQFEDLCGEIVPLLPFCQRTHAIRPEMKVLAALNFYATGSYQRAVGANFLLGFSQQSISECLAEVTDALNDRNVLIKYINFPRNEHDREKIRRRFMEKIQFPGIVGCIDGTHVAIIRPHQLEEVYFNRKHYHSINVLIICDADLRTLHVDASFGGASHDSHVWNNCPIQPLLQDLHRQGQTCWLLGDSGYALRPYMLTPILHVDPETPEGNYTKHHVRTRNVVERCFGVLKTRFRCLLAHRVLHYSPIKAGKIVNACAVLHNLINDHNNVRIDEEVLSIDRAHQPSLTFAHEQSEADGLTMRNAVVARLQRRA